MSDALNPSGPAQPDLSDAYTAPGNPATNEPAEKTQASRIANDDSVVAVFSPTFYPLILLGNLTSSEEPHVQTPRSLAKSILSSIIRSILSKRINSKGI